MTVVEEVINKISFLMGMSCTEKIYMGLDGLRYAVASDRIAASYIYQINEMSDEELIEKGLLAYEGAISQYGMAATWHSWQVWRENLNNWVALEVV